MSENELWTQQGRWKIWCLYICIFPVYHIILYIWPWCSMPNQTILNCLKCKSDRNSSFRDYWLCPWFIMFVECLKTQISVKALFFFVCVLEETYIQYDMTGTRLIYHVPVTVIQVLLSASVCGNKGQEAYCLNLCPQFFYHYLCCYPRGPHGRLQ